MKFKSVLFDLDGTLVDTEPLKFQAHQAALGKTKLLLTETHFQQAAGMSHADARDQFIKAVRSNVDPDTYDTVWLETYLKLIRNGINLVPGALDFLRTLKQGDVLTAVITSSDRELMSMVLKTTGLEAYVDATVCADDVSKSKPNPEPFLRAIELLSADPDKSIAVEDSFSGYQSAIVAGLRVCVRKYDLNSSQQFPDAFCRFSTYKELEEILNSR